MNKYCKIIDKIDELPEVIYEGYIWMSDKTEPRKIISKSQLQVEEKNPFIVEGFLISEDRNISISLSSMNGMLKIYQFDLNLINALPENQKTENSYLTHRFEDAKISFITVWLPEKDNLCQDMEVLRPRMRVFNGFEFKN